MCGTSIVAILLAFAVTEVNAGPITAVSPEPNVVFDVNATDVPIPSNYNNYLIHSCAFEVFKPTLPLTPWDML